MKVYIELMSNHFTEEQIEDGFNHIVITYEGSLMPKKGDPFIIEQYLFDMKNDPLYKQLMWSVAFIKHIMVHDKFYPCLVLKGE